MPDQVAGAFCKHTFDGEPCVTEGEHKVHATAGGATWTAARYPGERVMPDDLHWHRCTPDLRQVMESMNLRPYRECAEAPTLTDADEPGSHLHGVPMAVSATYDQLLTEAHPELVSPEPWPDWLSGLTPEHRVRAIIRAVAACHGADPCQDPAEHESPVERHCTVTMAGQFLLRLLGEARQQAPVPSDAACAADDFSSRISRALDLLDELRAVLTSPPAPESEVTP